MQVGAFDAVIVEHGLRTMADKEVVCLIVKLPDGETTDVLIWLTEKAAGIARQQLKVCGFQVDKADLWELQDDPQLLAGNKIRVLVDEYKGRLRASIQTNPTPTKRKMLEIQETLRALRSDADALPEDDEDLPF